MRRKGFSLIELLAVLVILGIIAAMALGRFTKPIESTRQKMDQTNIRRIQELVERYQIEQGNAPVDMQSLADSGYIDNAVISGQVDSSKSITFDTSDPYGTVRLE